MFKKACMLSVATVFCLLAGVRQSDADGPSGGPPMFQINVSGATGVVLKDATGRAIGDVDSSATKIPRSEYWAAPPTGGCW